MGKRMGIITLSVFYCIYFTYMGFSIFASKYFAEIGLNESQIGILSSVPALISMCFMPMWGAISDRLRLKKLVVAFTIFASGATLLLVDGLTDFSKIDAVTGALASDATKFWPLVVLLTVNSVFAQPVMPNATSIALEYTASVGRTYGPIRMLGTVGYQIGALLTGMILVGSLRYLYAWQAGIVLFSGFLALTLPNVSGHQHGGTKVSPMDVIKDRRVRRLLIMILVACSTTMFYQSFFGAFMEKLGVSNRMSSVITWVSVALEIPLLLFSSKIMKLRSVWQWMSIALVITGIRWIGFWVCAQTGSKVLLFIFQIPAVMVLACFEFFPSLYVGSIIAPELSSSAQNILNLVSFGIARFIGALLGGFVSQKIGMETMFMINGILLLAAAVVFWPMCRRMHKEDMALEKAN